MPKLPKPKNKHKFSQGKLTFGEAIERLKKNPDDPELQELKKTLDQFRANFTFPTQEFALYSASVKAALEALKPTIYMTEATSQMLKASLPSGFLISEILKPSFGLMRIANEVAVSQKRLIESFRMPNYLSESLKIVAKQVGQMGESMRLLSQSFAIYQTPNLFNELTKINTSWIVPGYVVTKKVEVVTPKQYEKELVEEEKIFSGELVILEENKLEIEKSPYYYYEASKTLLFKVTTLAAVPLYSKRGNSDIELLITTLLSFLDEQGEITGEFRRVFIPIQELISKLITRGIKNVTMDWIKATRSNFINHKIPDFLKDVIKISEFDRTKQGYYFEIRIAVSLPKKLF